MLQILNLCLIISWNCVHPFCHFFNRISESDNLHKKNSYLLLLFVTLCNTVIWTILFIKKDFQSVYFLILVLLLFSDVLYHLFETDQIGSDHSCIIDFRNLLHNKILQLVESDHELIFEIRLFFIIIPDYLVEPNFDWLNLHVLLSISESVRRYICLIVTSWRQRCSPSYVSFINRIIRCKHLL